MSGYTEISNDRAFVLGKMIVSFDDCKSRPVSFNAREYTAKCFGYLCSLLIYDNSGCYYKEEKIGEYK